MALLVGIIFGYIGRFNSELSSISPIGVLSRNLFTCSTVHLPAAKSSNRIICCWSIVSLLFCNAGQSAKTWYDDSSSSKHNLHDSRSMTPS